VMQEGEQEVRPRSPRFPVPSPGHPHPHCPIRPFPLTKVETEVRRRGRATEREKRREKRERREREEREMEKQPYYQRTSQYDPEMGYGKTEEEGGYATYMEKQVRHGFIRKVFSILAIQLFVTFGCAIGFSSSASLKTYLTTNSWPFYIAFPGMIGECLFFLRRTRA